MARYKLLTASNLPTKPLLNGEYCLKEMVLWVSYRKNRVFRKSKDQKYHGKRFLKAIKRLILPVK
jgi:hypothetical protein